MAGTQPEDFMDTFCPYNPLSININIGYSSNGTTIEKPGIYIDTNKARRLFVGTNEVESFIVDEEE
jgi:hypothetical protein